MRALQLLASARNLSEFCRFADRKAFLDELASEYPSKHLELTADLTAALVRGLELYLSSSSNSPTIPSSGTRHNQNDVQGRIGADGNSRGITSPVGSSETQHDSRQHLLVLAMAHMNWWGTCIRDDVLESRRLAVAHINSGEDIDCHIMFGNCLLETHNEY